MAIGLPSAAWTPLPQTRTFADMKKEVARFVLAPSDPEALESAGDGINNGIRRLNMRTWYWTIQTQDITLAASDADYTLNTLFKAPRTMEIMDSSSKPRLVVGWLPPKEFQMNFPKRDVDGTPDAYTVLNAQRDGLVQFDVPCASSFVADYPTARIHYYGKIALLTADSEQPSVISEAEEFLTWFGKEYCASIYDPEKFTMARAQREDAWRELLRDNTEYPAHDWRERGQR